MLAVENQNKYGISLLSEKQKKNSPKNLWEYVTKNPVSWSTSIVREISINSV